ncbi:MAG: GDSL-type esterase/lipase family protein [Planctomycetota bacterium]
MADRATDDGHRQGAKSQSSNLTPRPRLSPRHAMLFRMLGIAVGLFAGWMVVEGLLWGLDLGGSRPLTKRYLRSDEDRSTDFHCYPSNPHGEFVPVPDVRRGGPWDYKNYMLPPRSVPLDRVDETPWCVEYKYSAQGLRDREFSPFPPPGVLRIAAVGDSFVFGEGVPVERTLSRQMQSLLGERYEVMNCGRVGADNEFELRLLLTVTSTFHCNRVIFSFLVNDVKLTPELEKQQAYINDLIIIRDEAAEKQSHGGKSLFRLPSMIRNFLTMRNVTSQTIQWYLDSYDPRYNATNLAKLEKQIHLLGRIPGVRVAFVIYPLLEGLEKEYPLAAVHAKVAALAKAAGLPVLDLAPAFAGQKSSELWVHDTDHHPNGRAQAIAAQAIIDWLRREHPDFLELPPVPEADQGEK